MKCPNCNYDGPATIGPCPQCGVSRPYPIIAKSWEQKNACWLVPVIILSILIPAGVVSYLVYKNVQKQADHRKIKIQPKKSDDDHENQQEEQQQVENQREVEEPEGAPVAHGGVVKPEELHGHGKLYFVPVGKQAIPVQSLADYYLQKFKIHVTVLPALETRPADCAPARKQCVAEELQVEMVNAYPEVAQNPNSVMIALTDEDIFSRSQGWSFTYSWHFEQIGIVSTSRMGGRNATDAQRLASTKQMLTKYIAMMYFRVPISFDPTSIMYSPLIPNGGSDNLYESDLHSEDLGNGLRGMGQPCLFFNYSYETHKIKPEEPVLSSCMFSNAVDTTKEEHYKIYLQYGSLMQKAMDLQLNSTPPIALRRG